MDGPLEDAPVAALGRRTTLIRRLKNFRERGDYCLTLVWNQKSWVLCRSVRILAGTPVGTTMTIETRTVAPQYHQTSQQRRDSNSSTGYQDSPSEDDGYFTSAVSVQHKVSF